MRHLIGWQNLKRWSYLGSSMCLYRPLLGMRNLFAFMVDLSFLNLSAPNTWNLWLSAKPNLGVSPRKTSTSKKMEISCQPLKVFNNEYCFFVTVPDCSRYHSNHQKESYIELSLGTSKISSTNLLLLKEGGWTDCFRSTQQLMAKSCTKDIISGKSKIDKSHLMKLNDAEGIPKLLNEYGCQVLCLKMVRNKLDDHISLV